MESARIPQPFEALQLSEDGLNKTVRFLGGSVTFGPNLLPVSIKAGDTELLSAPVRFVGIEDGQPSVWETDYPENESECFVQEHDDAHAVLCGAVASERFIIDLCATVSYDGNISYDMKLMSRGRTVPQIFGLAPVKDLYYSLERLWLEVPMRRENVSFYQFDPYTPQNFVPGGSNIAIHLADGSSVPYSGTSFAGAVPGINAFTEFKVLTWFGNDKRGLGFFSDCEANWQAADSEHVLEWLPDGDTFTFRAHLLDSHPKAWKADPSQGLNAYHPISFNWGFQPTPVKKCRHEPMMNGLHIDCFHKIRGNYYDFLSKPVIEGDTENGFDRMKRLGVNTLILHEKWNKSQNYVKLSEYTEAQIKKIVRECHARGIKVLTYFGYEYSSMSPEWSEVGYKYVNATSDTDATGGWNRIPFQRDYVVCYNSDYADTWVEGIAHIMDTCHIDGVYLDGTPHLRPCTNTAHGCGRYDAEGVLYPTYPVKAVRRMFERLYNEVHSRGGIINVHNSIAHNFTAMAFIDLFWCGEALQFDYTKGNFADVPLDFFRTLYTGDNMGVPVEMIAYENRPIWNFENALSIALIHGILPRPNNIAYPLELMSGIWKIFDSFPIDRADWLPYWENCPVRAENDRIRCSAYRYTAPDGERMYLVLCSNITRTDAADVRFTLSEELSDIRKITDLEQQSAFTPESLTADIPGYGYKIYLMR